MHSQSFKAIWKYDILNTTKYLSHVLCCKHVAQLIFTPQLGAKPATGVS